MRGRRRRSRVVAARTGHDGKQRERDEDEGLSFLILCVLFLWDCWLFDGRGSAVQLSHDEFGTAFTPRDLDAADLERQLRRLDVLRDV